MVRLLFDCSVVGLWSRLEAMCRLRDGGELRNFKGWGIASVLIMIN